MPEVRPRVGRHKLPAMRDIETIDGELRLLSRAWRLARHMGCTPSTAYIDVLLDEPRGPLQQIESDSRPLRASQDTVRRDNESERNRSSCAETTGIHR
jgi:hypothetical protein